MYIIVVDLYHIKVTAEYSLLLADKIELEGRGATVGRFKCSV